MSNQVNSVMAGGRRRNLMKIKNGGPFYVRFEHGGKSFVRSLGTTILAAAKEKAKQIVDAVINDKPEVALQLKVRNDFSTLREICDRYIEKFAQDRRTNRTARGNVGALEKIVRVALGLELDKARANVLTGELVRKFEAAESQRIARNKSGYVDQASNLKVRTSIGSWLKQARSIFKRSRMSWFEDLNLPNLDSFREQGVQTPDRPRPRPLDPSVIAKMNAAVPALAKSNPAAYIAHLMFSRLGLRNSEIKAARKSWIENGRLGIINRPHENFQVKAKTERWVPVAAGVLAEIEKHWSLSPDGDFLVPAQHLTHRDHIVDHEHGDWCAQFINGHTKVAYELRRYAGSLVYKKTGQLAHVQQFLGHANIATTMEWYFYLLTDVPALEMTDFAGV